MKSTTSKALPQVHHGGLPAEGVVWHLDEKGKSLLVSPVPTTIEHSFFYESGNLQQMLAPGMVWFCANPHRWIFDRDGNPLFDSKQQEVYWLPVNSLTDGGVRVTNDAYNCWLDDEYGLFEIVDKLRKENLPDVEVLMRVDPEFVFFNSHREGALTGRNLRNRERITACYREHRLKGSSIDEAHDAAACLNDYEGLMSKDRFNLRDCIHRTREELEALWIKTHDQWLLTNTDEYDPQRMDEYRAWEREILVPGLLTVV
jgi:hypothetical protein